MNIFDKDQIGRKVRCKVLKGSCPDRSTMVGWVKWIHVNEGQVTGSIDVPGFGKLKGPWIVQEVNV